MAVTQLYLTGGWRSKARSFKLLRGCRRTYWPIKTLWIIRKAKNKPIDGDKVTWVVKANDKIQELAMFRSRIIRTAFEPGEFKWPASQELISMATVMTLRTISSVVAFFIFEHRPPSPHWLWMVAADSSGCSFHHCVTFSSCFSRVFILCWGSFRSFNHFLYWVSVKGWLIQEKPASRTGQTWLKELVGVEERVQ